MKMRNAARKIILTILVLSAPVLAFADRDWEHWNQDSISVKVNDKVNFLINHEWKFKEGMQNVYVYKLETGASYAINKYFEITPYYAWQEKKSGAIWDRSDYLYLDETLRFTFDNFFKIKLANRFRWQYDFDKGKTTLRDSVKVSRVFNVGKIDLTPYLSEEPFFDTRVGKFTEHRASSGVGIGLTKNLSLNLGYMLNAKKGTNKWVYANVLISGVNVKF